MTSFFTVLMIAAMLAALGSLVLGLVSMVKGGEFDKKYSTRLMQARVLTQGIALACVALAFAASKNG